MSEKNHSKIPPAKRILAAGTLVGVALTGAACSSSRGGEVRNEQIVTASSTLLSKSGSLAMQHFGVTGDYKLDDRDRPFTSHVIVECEPTGVPGVFEDGNISVFAYTNTLLGDQGRSSNGLEETVKNETCETYMPKLDTHAMALRVVRDDLTVIERSITGDGDYVKEPTKVAQQMLDQAANGLCFDGKACEGY